MAKKKKYPDKLELLPEILDIGYLSYVLQISDVQARELCKRGVIEHFKVGVMYRITRESLIRFIYGDKIPERLKGLL